MFYYVEYKKVLNPWGRVQFVMKPRVLNIYIGQVLISPLLLLWVGIAGIIDTFRKKPKVQDWTSYYFGKDEKVCKWNAYKKF